MKKIGNLRFAVVAWLVVLVAYVVALGQAGSADSLPFGLCAAVGAFGLAQALSDLLEGKGRA